MPIKFLPSPSREMVKRRLSYDRATGIFLWQSIDPITRQHRVWNTKHAGTSAGGLNAGGYVVIRLHEKSYFAHRLAYVYEYDDPIDNVCIDHINGIHADNRMENLRIATFSENSQNRSMRSYGASGVLGVKRMKNSNKWVAYARRKRSSIFIGTFDDKESAEQASFEWRSKNFEGFSGRGMGIAGSSS
jgi:hypothetical protein